YARALFTPYQVDSIFSKQVRATLVSNESAENSPWKQWLEETARQALRLEGDTAVSYLELRTYMVNTLLRDTDSMSMHHSLEVRVPLLDHPLVEFVADLPTQAKRRGAVNKALLVEALGDLLPQEVVQQRKRTFTLPWESWLRGPMGAQVGESLSTLT